MVTEVRGMGMEGESAARIPKVARNLVWMTPDILAVCTTLGMLSPEQAVKLKNAGLSAYNHNLDTSREFYPSVITSRTYDERLATIDAVREAGISVCSGGILGLGEKDEDRIGLIHEVSRYVLPASRSVIRHKAYRKLTRLACQNTQSHSLSTPLFPLKVRLWRRMT